MMAPRPLKSAWVVTWEWIGEHAAVEETRRVVTVLNYRWTTEKVRDLIEQMYVASEYSLSEKTRIARDRRTNPYRAKVASAREVHCGHNPWLRARFVRNFQCLSKDDGTYLPHWEELPPFDANEILSRK
jgi:hypothetical protein